MAVEAEIREQRALYEAGGTVEQSTRLFNGQTGEIRTMRTKEHAQDYRYFPEPDLPPVSITPELIAAVRAEIGEMPDARLRRYREQLGLGAYDAGVLVEHKTLGDYVEQLLAAGAAAKAAANWIISDCQGILKEKGLQIENCGITPARMAELLKLVEAGTINRATAKDKVLPVMLETGRDATDIVKEKGLAQVSDSAAIEKTVDEVLAKNPKLVQDYVGGKDATLNAIFGQCMKAFQGKANPSVTRPILERKLKALREKK
jgi:aspartyl-tRNA(Asn)/glutamyl-tRNA(Gln) amidotransferase subunit B